MLRRACACGGGCPKCSGPREVVGEDKLARAPDKSGRESALAPPIVHDVLRSRGQPINPTTRAGFERRFGYDFSHVRVHTGDQAARSAAAVNALAYTAGNHIVFGAEHGVSPNGGDGRLLAHELVHVMQWREHAIPARLPIGPADGKAERQAWTGPGGDPGQTRSLQRAVLICDEYRAEDAGSGKPCAGVSVTTSRSAKTAAVKAKLQTYGPDSNAANARTVQNAISRNWNGSFPDGYSVTTAVSVGPRPANQDADSDAIALELTHDATMPTHFNVLTHNMTANLNESDALTWAVPHEFGHALRLSDRYSEGFLSRLSALFGGDRSTQVEPGYEHNIMGITGGHLESRNIQDLIAIYTNYTCVRSHLESPL